MLFGFPETFATWIPSLEHSQPVIGPSKVQRGAGETLAVLSKNPR